MCMVMGQHVEGASAPIARLLTKPSYSWLQVVIGMLYLVQVAVSLDRHIWAEIGMATQITPQPPEPMVHAPLACIPDHSLFRCS